MQLQVSVIGQGYVGLPLAVFAARSGLRVGGFDIDEIKISGLKNGKTDSPEVDSSEIISLQSTGKLFFSSNIFDHKKSNIYIIAVPTPLDLNHNPNLHYLNHACELLAKIVKPNDLIVNESTSYIGTLRTFIKPLLEKISGIMDLKFVVAPERIDPGSKSWNLKNTPRNLSGLCESSTRMAFDFYSRFCDSINIVSKPEVAEAAKLFENTFRHVNIALVNELAEIADKLNFSANDTILAAATKPFGYSPFYPGIGVGGHCIPVDPSYLIFSAKQVGVNSKFIELANQVNLSIPNKIAQRLKSTMGGSLKGTKVQLAGITYKPDIADLRESPAIVLMKELKLLGALVQWHDPVIGEYNNEISQPLSTEIDLGIIVTPHTQVNYQIWRDSNIRVVDISSTPKNYGWPKFL
jgi:UDP-N-acetyl-D-glucosamine dehydrogenase